MHNLFTKKLSNIALSFHGDKGLQSFKRVKSYMFVTSALEQVPKEQMLLTIFLKKIYIASKQRN